MTDFVRARMDNGTHVTVSRAYAKMRGLHIYYGKPATNRAGQILPPKRPALKKAANTTPKKAAEATTEKE